MSGPLPLPTFHVGPEDREFSVQHLPLPHDWDGVVSLAYQVGRRLAQLARLLASRRCWLAPAADLGGRVERALRRGWREGWS